MAVTQERVKNSRERGRIAGLTSLVRQEKMRSCAQWGGPGEERRCFPVVAEGKSLWAQPRGVGEPGMFSSDCFCFLSEIGSTVLGGKSRFERKV